MKCCAVPFVQWFDFAQAGDSETMANMLQLGKGRYESRPAEQNKIYPGFTAIHYAALFGHANVVELLLEHEVKLQTKSTQRIPAFGISPFASFQLAAGSNCLMIALIAGQKQVARILIDYLEQHPTVFQEVAKLNEFRFTTYAVACICRFDEANEVLRSKLFQSELKLVTSGDLTPPMLGAYYCVPEVAKILMAMMDDQVARIVINLDVKGNNIVELVDREADLERINCTLEDKNTCQLLYRELSKKAITVLKGKADDLIKKFLKDRLEEDIFGKQAMDALALKASVTISEQEEQIEEPPKPKTEEAPQSVEQPPSEKKE